MKKQTLGRMIAALRKERGMTQADLAGRLGVTDKAVSKWERDLSCPDIASLPTLAQTLGVSVDELMQAQTAGGAAGQPGGRAEQITGVILKAVPLAMGVAVVVLSLLKQLDLNSGFGMLGVAVLCLTAAVWQGERKKED